MTAMTADNDPTRVSPQESARQESGQESGQESEQESILPQESKGEPAIFSAVITPHRSLGRRGFLILMLVLGGVSFTTGMVFLIAGAWPIFGFCGLDVLLVYWAFRVNFRRAAAYEQVTVTPSDRKRVVEGKSVD